MIALSILALVIALLALIRAQLTAMTVRYIDQDIEQLTVLSERLTLTQAQLNERVEKEALKTRDIDHTRYA